MLNETASHPAPGEQTPGQVASPTGNGLAVGIDDTDAVEIPFSRVVAGNYLVRVQVDGAESVLAQDGSGLFISPNVVLGVNDKPAGSRSRARQSLLATSAFRARGERSEGQQRRRSLRKRPTWTRRSPIRSLRHSNATFFFCAPASSSIARFAELRLTFALALANSRTLIGALSHQARHSAFGS